jgi:hypothetical protein
LILKYTDFDINAHLSILFIFENQFEWLDVHSVPAQLLKEAVALELDGLKLDVGSLERELVRVMLLIIIVVKILHPNCALLGDSPRHGGRYDLV